MAMVQTGFQGGHLGNQYQFSLLLLCAHRAVEAGVQFELKTEQKNVGVFDDIVLEVIVGGNTRYIFGQAKHKQTAGNLTFAKIMNDKNYKLSEYFKSWDEILKHYNNFDKDMYIITNNRIRTQKTQPNGLVKIDSVKKMSSSLYFVQDTSIDLIFKDLGKRYKFPSGNAFPAERQAVFQVLKNDFMKKNIGQDLSDFDDKLNSFMDQLVFVTSLEIKDIQDEIQKDLQKKFNISDVSIQHLKLDNCVKDSFTSKDNKRQKITKVDYENMLKEYELFSNSLLVMEKTRGIFEDDSFLEFQSTHKTIENFLDTQINPANKILNVKTQ
jgi:hypothetical protein